MTASGSCAAAAWAGLGLAELPLWLAIDARAAGLPAAREPFTPPG
ncbi:MULTISPECIES: hypothetical protein [unclassified Methylobacterium]|nr:MULTISPECIES: hypothetical protein [unclassified Methylobacterium]